MENIFQFRMKKTVLIVTHKLKNLENCDQIYKIENFNIKKLNNYSISLNFQKILLLRIYSHIHCNDLSNNL